MIRSRRRVLAYVASLAAAATPFRSVAAGAASPAASPSGGDHLVLGAATHFAQGWPFSWFDNAKSIDITELRDEVSWATIEPQPGVYKFDPYFFDFLDRARRNGVSMLLVMQPQHPHYDNGQTAFTPEACAAYANALAALLAKYGDIISGVEVGNEINGDGMKGPAAQHRAESHVLLLRAVWARVKPQYSKIAILGGSTNVIGVGFLEKIFAQGGLEVMDGVAIHPYRSYAEHVDLEFDALTEVMRRHGPVRPIWATEFGDQFVNNDLAPPHLLKMAAIMGAAHVKRAYWYALSDERWYRNMGLFDSRGGFKSVAKTFRLLQRELVPLGDPTRLPTDGRTYIYRYGANTYVMWGAERPIAITGQARARDASGKVIALPAALSADPVILDGAFTYTLGDSPVLADSFLEYGAAPWSYFIETKGGVLHPARRVDWDWTAYMGDRQYQPLQISPKSLLPGGNGANPLKAVLRYTAQTPLRCGLDLDLDLKSSSKGDGIDLQVKQNGKVIQSLIVKDRLQLDSLVLDLAPGDQLDFVIGPNVTFGGDETEYRIRLLRPKT